MGYRFPANPSKQQVGRNLHAAVNTRFCRSDFSPTALNTVHNARQAGFTLIEAIVVITIIGAIAAMATVYLRLPLEAYLAQSRRSALADSADGAMRFMAREIRTALPLSVRISTVGTATYIEFLPIQYGGRYRAAVNSAGLGNPLDFATAETTFDLLGAAPTTVTTPAWVAVAHTGESGESAYAGERSTPYGSISGNQITMTSFAFPVASPSGRFFLVGQPVSYECAPATSGDSGSGTLRRFTGYGLLAAQPTTITGTDNSLLAQNVSACGLSFARNASGNFDLLVMTMTLLDSGEQVRLFNQVQVDNAP